MKHLIILMICLFCWTSAKTSPSNSTITVETTYFFDDFKLGIIWYEDGTVASAKLNYNFLLQEMHFLNPEDEEDVLNLQRTPRVTHVEVEREIFVPVGKKGFAQVIQIGQVTLLRKKHFLRESKKIGAYGIHSKTAAIDMLASFNAGDAATHTAPATRLEVPVTYDIKTEFFLMKDGNIQVATRRNFLRVFREIRPQIELFLAEHQVNFNDVQHLRGLTRFGNNLLAAK